ncbi:MAG: hypothetical protein ACLTDX_22330 [[Clostridium] innocuum]
MQIIEIERLSRDYGEGRGIFDISFSIAEGEVFGFLGPNGAGRRRPSVICYGFLKGKTGFCENSRDGLLEAIRMHYQTAWLYTGRNQSPE